MFIDTLKRPFPFYSSTRSKWIIVLLFGLFISVFLIIFRPFGLNNVGKYQVLILSGYGLVTMLFLIINLFIVPVIFKRIFIEENWLVYKEILWILFIVFTIGLGNFIYTRVMFSYPDFNFSGILSFQFFTLAIAFLPVTTLILITQNRLLKTNLSLATNISNTLETSPKTNLGNNSKLIILDKQGKQKLEIDLDSFLFIESLGNYIKVHYLNENVEKTEVLRKTLTAAYHDLSNHSHIFKCHRAYLVNIMKVISVSGNAQGLKLKLLNSDFEVPVARNFIKDFKAVMN